MNTRKHPARRPRYSVIPPSTPWTWAPKLWAIVAVGDVRLLAGPPFQTLLRSIMGIGAAGNPARLLRYALSKNFPQQFHCGPFLQGEQAQGGGRSVVYAEQAEQTGSFWLAGAESTFDEKEAASQLSALKRYPERRAGS